MGRSKSVSDYEKETEELLKDKTIAKCTIDGYGVYLKFTDGSELEYDASDGGYSSWQLYVKGERA